MGPTCKNMNLSCENRHFNMGSMDICSFWDLPLADFQCIAVFRTSGQASIFRLECCCMGWT